MQEEFIVTKDFLVEKYPLPRVLKAFDTHFPSGVATIPRFLKFCEELDLFSLAQSLIRNTPKNPEPLFLDEYQGGNLFYNGDIHLKKGFECSGSIICRKLKVDGDIIIGAGFWVYANVCADGIALRGMLVGDGSSRRLALQGKARAHGHFKTIDAELRGSSILNGHLEALNIIKGEDARIDREFIFKK